MTSFHGQLSSQALCEGVTTMLYETKIVFNKHFVNNQDNGNGVSGTKCFWKDIIKDIFHRRSLYTFY